MNICLAIDEGACRQWMLIIAALVKKRPHLQLSLKVIEETRTSTGLDMLLTLEKMLVRRGRPCGCDPCSPVSLGLSPDEGTPDIILDFTARGIEAQAARVLRPSYDHSFTEETLAALLLAKGTPLISIVDIGQNRIVASGSASLEAATGIGGGLEAVYSRVAVLLMRVIDGMEDSGAIQKSAAISPISKSVATSTAVKGFAASIIREIYRLCCYPGHWRIGFRHIDGPGVMETGSLSGTQWQILSHPTDHFYADPFVITWQERNYLFFEDLDHHTGKGVISVCEFDENGIPGPARVVLEEPWHLSYPFLLEFGGDIFMIPESSSNRDVALYRATSFPLKWERYQTLLCDVEAADATLVQHNGAWWMFAVERHGVGGYSDMLCLYKADHPFGPWQPHKTNPVLVDHKTARPAGNFITRNGTLWRPVQDCADGYGAALGLAEITRLDDETYQQVVQRVVKPGAPVWPGHKLHSLNRSGRLEVIDGSIYWPKVPAFARLVEQHYRPAG